jgi:hypothetical protein
MNFHETNYGTSISITAATHEMNWANYTYGSEVGWASERDIIIYVTRKMYCTRKLARR